MSMRVIIYELELKDGRTVTITLPKDIPPGKYQAVLVIDESVQDDRRPHATYEELLVQTSGLWKQGDDLRYQEKIRDEWNK
jgi:hypothetical protein